MGGPLQDGGTSFPDKKEELHTHVGWESVLLRLHVVTGRSYEWRNLVSR